MESFNLTNPDDPRDVGYEPVRSWDYKEAVVNALVSEFDVPQRTAEVVAIDKKGTINACHKGKLSATQAARMVFENEMDTYRSDAGWRFA